MHSNTGEVWEGGTDQLFSACKGRLAEVTGLNKKLESGH